MSTLNDKPKTLPELIVKSDDPTKIPDDTIKKYMIKHRSTAMDAFKDLLSQDLLDRIKKSRAEKDVKIILKLLVQQVIGDGVKP